jgi:hypothetical protein
MKGPEPASAPLASSEIPFTSTDVKRPGFKCPCLASGAGFVSYGDLSERRRGALAWVTKLWADANGTYADRRIIPPGYKVQVPQLARAHLWGRQNGGSGTVAANLVTFQHVPANTPQMRDEENKIRVALQAGKTVCGFSVPVYGSGRVIPKKINLMAVDSDGNVVTHAAIINPAGQ